MAQKYAGTRMVIAGVDGGDPEKVFPFRVNTATGALVVEGDSGGGGGGEAGVQFAEDVASASGDVGTAIIAKRVDTAATQTTTDGDYTIPVANSNGQLRVGVNRTFQVGDSDSLLKAEDAASVSGDAGVSMLAVRQSVATDLSAGATNGDYEPLQVDANGALWTSMATALSKVIDSVQSRPEATVYVPVTATGLVRTGAGILVGMYVNSTTAGTIKLWDQTTAAVPVLNNTITPAVGYHNLGLAGFTTGLFATIGGTIDVTLYYIPTP